MREILFVCTGNTCRSSMAEGFFNAEVQKNNKLRNKYHAISAGLAAVEGDPASAYAQKVLSEGWSIDINSHRAKNVNPKILDDAFLILTMTNAHARVLVARYPHIFFKVHTLKDYLLNPAKALSRRSTDHDSDIADPFGGSLEVYRQCALEIKDLVDKLILKLETEDTT